MRLEPQLTRGQRAAPLRAQCPRSTTRGGTRRSRSHRPMAAHEVSGLHRVGAADQLDKEADRAEVVADGNPLIHPVHAVAIAVA